MKFYRNLILLMVFSVIGSQSAWANSLSSPDAWSTVITATVGDVTTDITGSTTDADTDNLMDVASGFEPSDMIWHSGLNKLILVGDEGDVCTMDADGHNADCINLGGYSWEGIAVADPSTDYIYLGEEFDTEDEDEEARIYEYNLSTQTLGITWPLGHVAVSTPNAGLEALTFVPNGAHPYADSASGGLFYVGSQDNGTVYVYDLNLSVDDDDNLIDEFTPISGYTDLAAMYYSEDADLLYLSYDNRDLLIEMQLDSAHTILNYYTEDASYAGQEAITVMSSCPNATGTIYIGFDRSSETDTTPRVYEYTGYPINCAIVDKDGDLVFADVDCDDYDATASTDLTYYIDADGDGLGNAAISVTDCTSTIPAGYVADSSDRNDSDFDNDGDPTASDCDDTDATVSSTTVFYADTDGDGLGDPANSTSVCGSTAPTGYVANDTDTDDTTAFVCTAIEYDDNGVDDDCDGSVDEVNKVATNGRHPTYSTLDASSTSDYSTYVDSIAVTKNGAILVTFVDNSVYYYPVFTSSSRMSSVRTTSVTSPSGNGHLVVTSSSGQRASVNAYTGVVRLSTRPWGH